MQLEHVVDETRNIVYTLGVWPMEDLGMFLLELFWTQVGKRFL